MAGERWFWDTHLTSECKRETETHKHKEKGSGLKLGATFGLNVADLG